MNKKYIEEKLTSDDPDWKEVKKAVKKKFKGTGKDRLMVLRYEKKMDLIPICRKMHISQTTYYTWREEILNAVMVHAAYRKLIKP